MCQGEETSLNNELAFTSVWTAQEPAESSTSARGLSAAASIMCPMLNLKALQHPSQSPFLRAHKPTLPLHLHAMPWWPSTSLCHHVSGSQQLSQGAGPDVGNALVCVHLLLHTHACSNTDPAI